MEKFLDAMNAIAKDIASLDIEALANAEMDTDTTLRIFNDILQPELSERKPQGGLVAILLFKWRRWWAKQKRLWVFQRVLI